MIFGIFLLLLIIAIYFLLFKGWLFKLALFFFGWLGLCAALWAWFPNSHHAAFTTAGGNPCPWAVLIPTIVCLLAMLTTKAED